MLTPQEEDDLFAAALLLAGDVRTDLAQAWRTVAHMSDDDLRAMCITLAAMVDEHTPPSVMAWWRVFAQDTA